MSLHAIYVKLITKLALDIILKIQEFFLKKKVAKSAVSSNEYRPNNTGLFVSGCTVTGCDKGILIDGSENVTIENSTIKNCDQGISVRNSKGIID